MPTSRALVGALRLFDLGPEPLAHGPSAVRGVREQHRERSQKETLFTELPRETVRKASDASATYPFEPRKGTFSAHFVLRILTKSMLKRCSDPFSDSLRAGILGNSNTPEARRFSAQYRRHPHLVGLFIRP